MIELKDVSKRLGKFELNNLSITIPEGYVCGLIGRNGAGKTSLFHILLGLYENYTGQLLIDDMTYAADEVAVRNLFGTVLGEDLLKTDLTLKENGDFYGRYYCNFDADKYEHLLEEFKLSIKARFGKLSRGQKLKAQFAFALACNPKYLVLDEPTSNFDPDFQKCFWEKIRDFTSNGTNSVIISTQQVEELETKADYLIYLETGKLIYSGDIESFRDKYRIAYGEKYKLKLIPKEELISMDEKEYSCRALVYYKRYRDYGSGVELTYPSLEEFMYLFDKRNEKNK